MEVTNRFTTNVMLLSLSLAAACSGGNARSRALPPAVDALRASLEPYSSPTSAKSELSLVGVEFVVPFAIIARSSPRPAVFAQAFSANDVFKLWALHVWTHRANPSGLFAPWNPRVRC